MVRNALIGLVMGGDAVLGWMGHPVPAWYTLNVVPNRIGYCMGEQGGRGGLDGASGDTHNIVPNRIGYCMGEQGAMLYEGE